jgi:hypothetical protein
MGKAILQVTRFTALIQISGKKQTRTEWFRRRGTAIALYEAQGDAATFHAG